jgi:hypothetical protein
MIAHGCSAGSGKSELRDITVGTIDVWDCKARPGKVNHLQHSWKTGSCQNSQQMMMGWGSGEDCGGQHRTTLAISLLWWKPFGSY